MTNRERLQRQKQGTAYMENDTITVQQVEEIVVTANEDGEDVMLGVKPST